MLLNYLAREGITYLPGHRGGQVTYLPGQGEGSGQVAHALIPPPPAMDRQTPVKTLSFLVLRMWSVIIAVAVDSH